MNTLRTASGRQLRGTGLHETPLPIAYPAEIMPGARVLGADGQIYESIKNTDTLEYEWKQRSQGDPGPALELQKTATEIQWRIAGSSDPWTTLLPLADIEGPQGETGTPGAGLSFQGSVATVLDLPATSTTGYGYKVDATDDIWVWNGTDWINMGPAVQGPPGPDGDQGAAGADGDDGAPVELRKTLTDIEWRLLGQSTWNELVPLEELQGPVGDDGAPGPTGPAFSYRGSVATVGNLPTPSTQGYAYEVTATGDTYIYNGLVWVNAGVMRGPKGDAGDLGPTGPAGSGFSFQGSVPTVAALPTPSTQGFAYKVEATDDLHIYNGTTWVNAGQLRGPKGDQGDQGDEGPQGEAGASFSYRGTVATVAALPSPSTVGHAYKIVATGELYIYNGLVWINAGVLEGAKGDQGDPGPAGAALNYRGTVATVAALPSPSTVGFAYKVDATGELYIYNGTSWLNGGPLQGPQGVAGDEGLAGPQGPGFNYQGALATVGELPTPSTQGFAYRIGTDLYIYNGTSWVNAGALQGPKGDQGDKGDKGDQGMGFSYRGSVPTVASLPSPSTTGFGYKVEASGDLYIYNGTSWVNAGPLQGPQGIQGIQGIQGLQGTKGDTGDIGVATASAPITYDSATKAIGISAATVVAAGSMSAADKSKLDGIANGATALTSSSTPQFAGLGLGTAAVSGWELTTNGGVIQNRTTLTASSGAITMDVRVANEFVTSAAISSATSIDLSTPSLTSVPSGYVWRGVLSFLYSAGTIIWLGATVGYTAKWDGGTAMTLTDGEVETVVITFVGGTTTIEITPLKGRA